MGRNRRGSSQAHVNYHHSATWEFWAGHEVNIPSNSMKENVGQSAIGLLCGWQNMRAFSVSLDSSSPLVVVFSQSVIPPITLLPARIPIPLSSVNYSQPVLARPSRPYCNCTDSPDSTDHDDENEIDNDEVTDDYMLSSDEISDSVQADGVYIEIERLGKRTRRIRSMIAIEASLDTIWDILTDYEKLSDFIPGLAVSQLIEKKDKFARLYQIGQQNLLFGLKFNAKGILDCYEKELENFPSGTRRVIEFKMTEGDFQLFEGKWTIEQFNKESTQSSVESDPSFSKGFETTLSYSVDVKPKLWLPVGLVEGRLCQEIKVNLSSIRERAQKVIHNTVGAH